MKTWIVFDCHYLARRAHYAMIELGGADAMSGATFGFLRDIADIQLQFGCTNPIFCWDMGYTGRKGILPGYKKKREEAYAKLTGQEKDQEDQFHEQVRLLRTEYVPAIGYRNSFAHEGYEADDIIASIVQHLPPDEEAIIVSSDQDLYQLLDGRVRIYNAHPKAKHRIVDLQIFWQTYGLLPAQWRWVKAIGGCSGDDVPGVGGVAEGTAIKYIKGELPDHHKSYKTIESSPGHIARNMRVVQLPFPGTPVFRLREDAVTVNKWKALADELGMTSLRDKPPMATRPGIRNGFDVIG